MKKVEKTAMFLFSGIGGGALGFQNANSEYRGIEGHFRTLCGIDVDPEICQDFENITGASGIQMDLFSRQDYIDFHGEEPPKDWKEAVPQDLLDACGGEYPDVVFTSPPCKGFSGLLPQKSAMSQKYQALDNLTIRGIWLLLEAFKENLPSVILLENVPRIKTRGKKFLSYIKQLMGQYGYVFSDNNHDCGEIGGLSQSRKRYLLIARNPSKLAPFIYEPEKYDLQPISAALNHLPMPNDPKGGPMHRMPRLQWKTWVRLALIPAGGDWRALEDLDWENYRIAYQPRGGAYRVSEWDKPATTVTAATKGIGQSNGVSAVSDPRLPKRDGRHSCVYKVLRYDEECTTVTGTRFGSGAQAVADPRTNFKGGTHRAIYRICKWDDTSGTVTGAYRPNNGALCINDPRITSRPHSGTYGVIDWNETAKTVIGSADVHAGTAAVADPRLDTMGKDKNKEVKIPQDQDSGVFIIIAEDGCWHRPLTTYELAMLQGFPTHLSNGQPFQLVGRSDSKNRQKIGNAVPPAAALGIAETILFAMLAQHNGDLFYFANTKLWVAPKNQSIVEEISS